jgi:hypothetical protein
MSSTITTRGIAARSVLPIKFVGIANLNFLIYTSFSTET